MGQPQTSADCSRSSRQTWQTPGHLAYPLQTNNTSLQVPGISVNGKTGTRGRYLFPEQTYAIAKSGPCIYLGSNIPSLKKEAQFAWEPLAEITDPGNLASRGKPGTSRFWIADGCQTHHANEFREFLLSDDDSVHLIQMSNAPGDLNPDWDLPRLNVEVTQVFGGVVASFQDWRSRNETV